MSMILNDPITEDWLKSVGFRWDEWERSGGKHWTIWFGDVQGGERSFASFEDLGVELCRMRSDSDDWNCWLRSDCSHKYSRFIHLRYLRVKGDVIRLIVALTCLPELARKLPRKLPTNQVFHIAPRLFP